MLFQKKKLKVLMLLELHVKNPYTYLNIHKIVTMFCFHFLENLK